MHTAINPITQEAIDKMMVPTIRAKHYYLNPEDLKVTSQNICTAVNINIKLILMKK